MTSVKHCAYVEEEDPSATRPPPMAHGTGAREEVRVAADGAVSRH